MSGRHKFSDLEAGLPPSRRSRIARLVEKLEKQLGEEGCDVEGFAEVAEPAAKAFSTSRHVPARPDKPRVS